MEFREPQESEKALFNSVATHPVQSWEWGEFRKRMGVKLVRRIVVDERKVIGSFQLTIHTILHTLYTVGYMPKCLMLNEEVIKELQVIGKQNNSIFIKLEPHILKNPKLAFRNLKLTPSPHPSFAQYTFQVDLTKSEDELLRNMHQKTRYNIRVAQKHGVEIIEDNSDKALQKYLALSEETTRRQHFYAHNRKYHREMWRAMREGGITYLFLARYKEKILTTWILFIFNDVLYYPYGASSSEFKEVMANNLMMWEAIRFGKKMKCRMFDMWGSLGLTPNTRDPWYGFHRFKEGYGGKLVEFIGSYDLVLNPFLYQLYNLAHRARWLYLKMKAL